MDEETTTGLTVTVREEDMTTTNEFTIRETIDLMVNTGSPTMLFTGNWLREIIDYPDFDVEINDFRFKRDQKTMIMRMKKKERRRYLKTLRSFLKS